jgi:2-phosphosulfolactate phosphatase
MRIDLHLTPLLVDDLSLREKTVVVIDVLRASTTIVTALSNGAREVIPVATVESAVKISGTLHDGGTLLGGERHGKKIEGFDLGNSPAEYTSEKVNGKAIVFSSTNGSQALVRARYARELMLCGFVNISIVAGALRAGAGDVSIVCAGRNGAFSMEDTVCAGMLIARIMDGVTQEVSLSDSARASQSLYKSFGRSLLKMLRSSDHGRYLLEIGFGGDLAVCASVDALPLLVRQEGNVLRARRMQGEGELIEEAAAHS